MPALENLGHALEERLAFRALTRRMLDRLFPTHWSFLLGEVTLFSFVGLVASGVYLALFYRPATAPVVWHGRYAPLAGQTLPDAFASVVELSTSVRFGLVARRFHHFAAHFFVGSLLLHAARVYFTGAFRRPRELTWLIGLTMLALALVNGFTGYSLPFDMRAGTAMRMMVTTMESIPWMGAWLATLVIGAPFPGGSLLSRLYIAHVFIGPALITVLIGVHVALIVRVTHTNYPARGSSNQLEVGGRLWPYQTAHTTTLAFLVFGALAFLSAFFPVEAAQVYGPFQSLSSYEPLSPDWFLMWIEGAYRLFPGWADFRFAGAHFTNPFYGAILLPVLVLGCCALYPWIDRRVYGGPTQDEHILQRWTDRPFRTAFGAGGLSFLVLLSCAAINDRMASAWSLDIWQVNLIWSVITLVVPCLVWAAFLIALRRSNRVRGFTGPLPQGGVLRRTARGFRAERRA
jgi:ubiquinol-cytochrome c reductase cytochrome b subunit